MAASDFRFERLKLRDAAARPDPEYEVSDAQVDALPTLPPESGNPMRVGHFRVYHNGNLEPLDHVEPVIVGAVPAYKIKGRLAMKIKSFSLNQEKAQNWHQKPRVREFLIPFPKYNKD